MRFRIESILIMIVFFVNVYLAQASNCYDYYTISINAIKIKKDKGFLIKTVKDLNGISIVSYKELPLKNIKTKNLHIVSENADGIFIANSEFYYWLENSYELEQPVIKILKRKEVKNTIGKQTFLINGKWTHVYYNRYLKKIEYTVINDFPPKPLIIKKIENCYLIKDKNNVYSYNEDKKTLKVIPNLVSSQTCFFETNWLYDNHFLYDDNSFYLIRLKFANPVDLTKTFKSLGIKNKFTGIKVRKVNYDYFLEFNDGKIWAYIKHGFLLEDKSQAFFYPIDNGSYNEKLNMIYFKNRFYSSEFNLRYEKNDIDFSLVQNKENLKMIFENTYFDGKTLYQINEKNKLEPTKKYDEIENFKDFKIKYNNALHSYQHNTSMFGIDSKNIYYQNKSLDKFEKLTSYQSKIKDLKLAYAFDNSLLIENEIIHSDMDLETVEFIGSNVLVINFCDGDGKNPVEVKYNYYFKDKNGIYLFTTGKKELQKFENAKYKDYNEETFSENFLQLGTD